MHRLPRGVLAYRASMVTTVQRSLVIDSAFANDAIDCAELVHDEALQWALVCQVTAQQLVRASARGGGWETTRPQLDDELHVIN